MSLAEELRKADIARLDAGDRQIAKGVTDVLGTDRRELTAEDRARLSGFVNWCAEKGARHCAAKPTTIAAYVLDQHSKGVVPDRILEDLAAIAALHDYNALPNPIATEIVSAALARVLKASQPPRSWPREEKSLWPTLPRWTQAVIAKREADRERVLRSCQNELAELKKATKQKEDQCLEDTQVTRPGTSGAQPELTA